MASGPDEANGRVTALLFMKYQSERVPGKNYRTVGGKPLFSWIFEALTTSRLVDRVVLNTDSRSLADMVLERFDVTVHMRPEHLLSITSNEANQILAYDIDRLRGEHFLQVHSTTPLLSAKTIDLAIETYFGAAKRGGFDSLFTVTPHRKRFFTVDGRPVNHDPRHLVKTQELTPLLEENSCGYVFSRTSFHANGGNRVGLCPYLLEIDASEAIDIDTEDELQLADKLLLSRMRSRDLEKDGQ